MTMWMVRAGFPSFSMFSTFMSKGIVAIRFGVNEDLSGLPDSSWEFEKFFDRARPQEKSKTPRTPEQRRGYVQEQARQLRWFVHEIKSGRHLVITYGGDRNGRSYFIGNVSSGYFFDRELGDRTEHHHVRKVKWTSTVNRDNLSSNTKKVLGIPPTIFHIDPTAEKEILDKCIPFNVA